jgi:hypothetical protein
LISGRENPLRYVEKEDNNALKFLLSGEWISWILNSSLTCMALRWPLEGALLLPWLLLQRLHCHIKRKL